MSKETLLMAKVRARIRREHAAAEEAAEEGGELNLVPYLDIVTNVVIFLLATVSSAIALGNINVSAPRYSDPATASSSSDPEDNKPKLNLTVAVSNTGFIVGGAGGVMKHSDGSLPTIRCSQPLKGGRCPAYLGSRVNDRGEREPVWVDNYDYGSLKKLLENVKTQYPNERQVILNADRRIPYQVIVRTMDLLRGNATKACNGKDGCYFDQVVLSAGVQ